MLEHFRVERQRPLISSERQVVVLAREISRAQIAQDRSRIRREPQGFFVLRDRFTVRLFRVVNRAQIIDRLGVLRTQFQRDLIASRYILRAIIISPRISMVMLVGTSGGLAGVLGRKPAVAV
jgi:hypothetical protein